MHVTLGSAIAVAAAILSLLPSCATAQEAPPGTYDFVLCHPSCSDSSSRIGSGVFVIVHGDIRRSFTRNILATLGSVTSAREPNACFRVSALRHVGNREYYPGIIPMALSSVAKAGRAFSLGLYASPDAFFSVILDFDSTGGVTGQGLQNDWDGRGPPELSVLSARRRGGPEPHACIEAR